MMGWWKPYFFWDVTGVQVLVPGLVVEGWLSFAIISAVIFGVCFVDQYLSQRVSSSSSSSSSGSGATSSTTHAKVAKDVLLYTLSRFVSGLVMLIMMSFNVVLYLQVIVFLGASELYFRVRKLKLLDERQQFAGGETAPIQQGHGEEEYHDEDIKESPTFGVPEQEMTTLT